MKKIGEIRTLKVINMECEVKKLIEQGKKKILMKHLEWRIDNLYANDLCFSTRKMIAKETKDIVRKVIELL